ncbi:MAG: hypothetical protein ACI4F3_08135, partial [Enterocloster sp.]
MKRYTAFFLSISLLASMTACASSGKPIAEMETLIEDTSGSQLPEEEAKPLPSKSSPSKPLPDKQSQSVQEPNVQESNVQESN